MPHRRFAGAAEAIICPKMSVLLPLMGQEIRYEIIQRLALAPCNVSTLARMLELADSDVSEHLGALHEHGLVVFDRCGKEHIYRLSACVRVQIEEHTIVLTMAGRDGAEVHIRVPMPKPRLALNTLVEIKNAPSMSLR